MISTSLGHPYHQKRLLTLSFLSSCVPLRCLSAIFGGIMTSHSAFNGGGTLVTALIMTRYSQVCGDDVEENNGLGRGKMRNDSQIPKLQALVVMTEIALLRMMLSVSTDTQMEPDIGRLGLDNLSFSSLSPHETLLFLPKALLVAAIAYIASPTIFTFQCLDVHQSTIPIISLQSSFKVQQCVDLPDFYRG